MDDVTGYALLCSRDPLLIEAVEVSAAALDVELRVAGAPEEAAGQWAGAAVRLVGVEVARRSGSPGRGSAHLVGASVDELARCSAELGLPVIPLPEAADRLGSVLAGAVRSVRAARTVAVVGASGGLGVSTLVVSLAMLAARGGARAVAVDLAPASGGLDLLVGAETVRGLRWSDLGQARGELGDVFGGLPQVDGAAVLSRSRQAEAPGGEAVEAVLGGLGRSSDVVVIDAGRGPAPPEAERVLVVVGADVRSVAAAQMLDLGRAQAGIVVRSGPGRTVPESAVCRSLGAECAGVIGSHKALPRLAELGMTPVAGASRRYAKQVSRILGWVRDA